MCEEELEHEFEFCETVLDKLVHGQDSMVEALAEQTISTSHDGERSSITLSDAAKKEGMKKWYEVYGGWQDRRDGVGVLRRKEPGSATPDKLTEERRIATRRAAM